MTALPLLLGLSLLAPAGSGHGAHEHGVTSLDIVIEASQMLVVLDGAGYNFVGFERAPASAEENEAIVQALSELSRPQALFGLPEAARCAVSNSLYEGLPSADWSASDVDALEHRDDGHGHEGGHGHHHGKAHGNWRISLRFDCDQPEVLRALQPRLFEAFPRTQELRWQLVSGSHQDGGRLQSPGGRIGLLPSR